MSQTATAPVSANADTSIKTDNFTTNAPFQDDDLVTVLHGYGRVDAKKRNDIDGVIFMGGVARDVPYSVARQWEKGTRSDGKPTYGRVKVFITDNSATEADFMKITGMSHMPTRELVAQMAARDIDEIAAILGPDKLQLLAAWQAAHKPTSTKR